MMKMNIKNTLILTGASIALTAATVGASKPWIQKNFTKSHMLPAGDEKPFPNSYFLSCEDYRIHYRIDESKTGTTKGKIFLIHGFGCSTIFFDEMVDILTKQGYRCVRADVPNFGYSTREGKNVKPIDRQYLMFDVMEAIDAQGKWILAGHSMGGGISLDMAIMKPEKFSAVAIFGPMLALSLPEFVSKIARVKAFSGLLELVIRYGGGFKPLIKWILIAATMDRNYMENFNLDLVTDALTIKGTGTGLCYMLGNAKQLPYEAMGEISIPIHLVWGGKDLMMTKGMAAKLQSSLSDPEIISMDKWPHCMIQTQADKVTENMLAFLDRNHV
jgi:pimeloyl-ACP methyl ester carboxylesterase